MDIQVFLQEHAEYIWHPNPILVQLAATVANTAAIALCFASVYCVWDDIPDVLQAQHNRMRRGAGNRWPLVEKGRC